MWQKRERMCPRDLPLDASRAGAARKARAAGHATRKADRAAGRATGPPRDDDDDVAHQPDDDDPARDDDDDDPHERARATVVAEVGGGVVLAGAFYFAGAFALLSTCGLALRRVLVTRGRSLTRMKHLKTDDAVHDNNA